MSAAGGAAPPPAVAVVIPCHDGAGFLPGAVQSALDASQHPLEIVVVDDGSSDDTPAVAAALAPSARSLRQENRGPSAARNAGLAATRAPLVAFLDVDDRWEPGSLDRLRAALDADPSAGVAQGLVQEYVLGPGPASETPRYRPYRFVNLGTMLARRTVFERVGGFDEDLWRNEDTDWWFRSWEAGVRKALIDEVVLRYRLHDGGMTAGAPLAFGGVARLLHRHRNRALAAGVDLSRPTSAWTDLAEYLGWRDKGDAVRGR